MGINLPSMLLKFRAMTIIKTRFALINSKLSTIETILSDKNRQDIWYRIDGGSLIKFDTFWDMLPKFI